MPTENSSQATSVEIAMFMRRNPVKYHTDHRARFDVTCLLLPCFVIKFFPYSSRARACPTPPNICGMIGSVVTQEMRCKRPPSPNEPRRIISILRSATASQTLAHSDHMRRNRTDERGTVVLQSSRVSDYLSKTHEVSAMTCNDPQAILAWRWCGL